MRDADWPGVLGTAYRLAVGHLESLPDRPVGGRAGPAGLRPAVDLPLPDGPADPRQVIERLAAAADPGLVASPGGRYFGFVVGGALPAALAADWLTSAWDQNACLNVLSPAAAVVEETAGRWVTDLLGLPEHASVGFVTGGQAANMTALAAARHEVLRRAGWNVEADGLAGAPPVRVVAGSARHGTIDRALRFLGLGTGAVVPVPADGQGRMRPAALEAALAGLSGPAIVCAQAGEVNTGAFDPIGDICEIAHRAGAWVHVDGAFGLWAAASPELRHLPAGAELADSWATDAHKWLNVPYDSGLAICADPAAHRAAMGATAAYLQHADGDRDAMDYNPESSRRARGFPVYAALLSLGRSGVAELVERCWALARRFAGLLDGQDGVEVLNEVVLNQVLVRFHTPGGDSDRHTRAVIERIQRDGTCWMSGTTWQGRAAMRISVSGWSTDEADVDASAAAVLRCARGR